MYMLVDTRGLAASLWSVRLCKTIKNGFSSEREMTQYLEHYWLHGYLNFPRRLNIYILNIMLENNILLAPQIIHLLILVKRSHTSSMSEFVTIHYMRKDDYKVRFY